MIHRSLTRAALLVAGLTSVGCGGNSYGHADLAAWRASAEQYVNREGNGDLNELRNVGVGAQPPAFTLLGGADPEGSTDVSGMIMGRRMIAGRPWHLFLVGVVDDQKLTSIRLAAVAGESPNFDWRIGEPDKQAFDRYQQSVARFAGVSSDPLARWKSGADQFHLEVKAGEARVTHVASGAVWRLDTTARPATSAKKNADAAG